MGDGTLPLLNGLTVLLISGVAFGCAGAIAGLISGLMARNLPRYQGRNRLLLVLTRALVGLATGAGIGVLAFLLYCVICALARCRF